MFEASDHNNRGNMLERSGDFVGAEAAHKKALELKIDSMGRDSIQAALSMNALGELYLKMDGKLDEAQKLLEDADEIRRRLWIFL